MGDKHKPWPIGPVTISPLFDFLFISLGLSLLFDLLLVDPCDSICIGLLLLSSSIILHSLAHARLLSRFMNHPIVQVGSLNHQIAAEFLY
ncbi:unnamed protein product [Lactuca virosa]|uniref:Uncharacterized protein n=1 Tax=Lactuca virosa TaxID=75947 RepID=A0AAU9MVV5_9ASTR|nr:unnamed protein product [Lactuca virosa]